ncbi:hypothetical protein [Planotetraspora sp. GP83]|uniref:hypothetical protein n=1 Tax=Planotetraspora sp. GP83 TaxID=3156264 RepID=UPI003510FC49
MVDTFVQRVILARLSRDDVSDLLPGVDASVDVTALREELAMLNQSEVELGLSVARRTLSTTVAEVAQAEIDKRRSEIHAELKSATAESPLAEFATTDDPARTWKGLTLGRRREIVRLLVTVTLLPVRGRPAGGEIDPDSVRFAPVPAQAA